MPWMGIQDLWTFLVAVLVFLALPGPGTDDRAHPVLESGEVIDAKALPAGDGQPLSKD